MSIPSLINQKKQSNTADIGVVGTLKLLFPAFHDLGPRPTIKIDICKEGTVLHFVPNVVVICRFQSLWI